MAVRNSSINPLTNLAYSTTGEDVYSVIKAVSEHLEAIDAAAYQDLQALTDAWNEAKDFSEITVVGGDTAGWDSVNKVLTVPTVKGEDGGPGMHHIKPTNTTEVHGDFGTFGELDTYTIYGDANESINLGSFVVRNGIGPDKVEPLGFMRTTTYDTDGSGVVDNAEAVGGKSLTTLESERDAAILAAQLSLGTTYVVEDNTGKDALTGLTVGDLVHVSDDGDGKWAQYMVETTTDGQGSTSTYAVVMDEDTYLNVNTKEAMKAAYESNPDTNAYTDVEKALVASALQSETVTSISFDIATSTLTYNDENGTPTLLDLSSLLDEDNRAIASGVLNPTTGVVTFTRDDATTFELDLSALLDDTNLVTSVAGKAGVVTLVKADITDFSDDDYATAAQGLLANSALQSSDIGVTLQAYDANLVSDANYVATEESYTTVEKTKLSGIEEGATADQIASEVPVVPTGNLVSNNVQSALVELQNDVDTKANKAQTSSTDTVYTDNTTALNYKIYVDGGKLIMEEV